MVVRLVVESYRQGGIGQIRVKARPGVAMASIGVKVISSPNVSPWGRRAVVENPEGHRIELTEPEDLMGISE